MLIKFLKPLMLLNLFFLSSGVLSKTYPLSDHYDGEKFFNPHNHQLKGVWDIIKWRFTSSAIEWPENVPVKNYPLPDILDKKGAITFINHATFLIQLQGMTILTDPIYSMRASPVKFAGPKRAREPGVGLEILPPIDVVVVSHNHYDHLDLETLQKLDAKFHPLFLVPLGDERLLKEAGIQNVKEMDWWEEIKVKETRFVFTPSQHWSARGLFDKCKSLWGSFYLEHQGSKIYFAGDTGAGKHFVDIKTRLGAPDYSLLPIGAYEPRWFMKSHHMNPEEAVNAHLELSSDLSFGMHFGTFQLTDEGIEDPVKALEGARKKLNVDPAKFQILDQGQSYIFN